MFELNRDVIFVQGAKNGAIYNFNTGKVYSVNDTACEIIKQYKNNPDFTACNRYLERLRKEDLVSKDFVPRPFQPIINNSINLEVAWIEITEKCNLKCVHCYEGNVHESNGSSLSIDQWKDVIKQLANLNIKRLIIIGGEPGCYPYLNDIINYAACFPIDITLFTNATCFTEKLLDCVVKNKIQVKVSVYGHCGKIHDSVTGVPGSFDKMTTAIEKLISHGISVSSALIILKENQDYLNEIIDFIKSTGMKYSRYDVIRQVYGGTQNTHTPTNKDIISKLYMSSPNFRTTKDSFFHHINRNTCWYGKIAIKENGDVIPCEFERKTVYGNVLKESITDIIYSDKARQMWFWDFKQVDGCCDCEFRYACKDCRPLGYSVCGNLHTKNPRCCYDVYNGRWG